MPAIDGDRTRLLVKVSTLYYMDGLSQQEIADRLGISRPQVSRLLRSARSAGIVEIRIRNPYPDHFDLERELEQRLHLQQAVVAGTGSGGPGEELANVARAAAAWLEESLVDRQRVGVMSGTTLSAVAQALAEPPPRQIAVVPMIGGQGPEGAHWHANETARVLAAQFGGRHYLLNAPAVVAHAASREVFMAEPDIRKVLDLARASELALLGIATASFDSTTVKAGGFHQEEVQALIRQGVVGNIGSGFFTADGRTVETELEQRFIGLQLKEIRRIPRRVGVACGEQKALAILGAIRGGWVNAIITSDETARAILRLAEREG